MYRILSTTYGDEYIYNYDYETISKDEIKFSVKPNISFSEGTRIMVGDAAYIFYAKFNSDAYSNKYVIFKIIYHNFIAMLYMV